MGLPKGLTFLEFAENLMSGERELRNRRFIVEADAVKMAIQIILPLALEMYEETKDGNDGEQKV